METTSCKSTNCIYILFCSGPRPQPTTELTTRDSVVTTEDTTTPICPTEQPKDCARRSGGGRATFQLDKLTPWDILTSKITPQATRATFYLRGRIGYNSRSEYLKQKSS